MAAVTICSDFGAPKNIHNKKGNNIQWRKGSLFNKFCWGDWAVMCEIKKLDVQAGFRKGRGTRYQIANICWSMEKARELQKNISFCFIDYAKAFDCVDHNKLWEILKEMGIPDHLTCP